MRYFKAREERETQDAAFRMYVGTGIQFIVENTAEFVGSGKGLRDYVEFIGLKEVDNRTGDEVAAEIIKRAGLRLNDEPI